MTAKGLFSAFLFAVVCLALLVFGLSNWRYVVREVAAAASER
ncbi:MAG TPA: hypothetical protein VG099_27435 [Gemmataceae bacterium]|nr:hypothetical protein [Gemmataceae bacterium]